jgi:hypothetical protein
MTPNEEDQNQTQRRSPTATDKRPLSPDPTDSSIKKQRHDSSPSPLSPNVDTTDIASFTSDQTSNNTAQSTDNTLKDTSSKPEAEKQDDTPNGSTNDHSSKDGEMHYQETFSVVGGKALNSGHLYYHVTHLLYFVSAMCKVTTISI